MHRRWSDGRRLGSHLSESQVRKLAASCGPGSAGVAGQMEEVAAPAVAAAPHRSDHPGDPAQAAVTGAWAAVAGPPSPARVQAVTSHSPSAGQAAQAAARLLNRICSPFRQTGRTVPRCVVGLSHWQSSSCRATVGISSSRLKDGLIIISVASTGLDNSRILH